jgi:hypothetical protein
VFLWRVFPNADQAHNEARTAWRCHATAHSKVGAYCACNAAVVGVVFEKCLGTGSSSR